MTHASGGQPRRVGRSGPGRSAPPGRHLRRVPGGGRPDASCGRDRPDGRQPGPGTDGHRLVGVLGPSRAGDGACVLSWSGDAGRDRAGHRVLRFHHQRFLAGFLGHGSECGGQPDGVFALAGVAVSGGQIRADGLPCLACGDRSVRRGVGVDSAFDAGAGRGPDAGRRRSLRQAGLPGRRVRSNGDDPGRGDRHLHRADHLLAGEPAQHRSDRIFGVALWRHPHLRLLSAVAFSRHRVDQGRCARRHPESSLSRDR